MTNPEELQALAERVEALDEPDRELDGLIEIARDPDREIILGEKEGRFPRDAIYGPVKDLVITGRDLADYISAPAYTASLDAAMLLVPEGWTTDRYHQGPSGQAHWWDLITFREGAQHHTKASGKAATPALALTAAALRALAQEARDG